MNVLQILPELNIGGVETGTVDLVKYLVKNGHKAVVVSCGGELVKDLISYGGIHYALAVNEKSIFTMIRMVKEITRIIKKEDIQIVHARSRVPAWIAFFACRKTNAVFITTCHGYYSMHLFSQVMGWGKLVICPSNVIARHMIEDFFIPYDHIRLIPRSVDLERFRFVSLKDRNHTVFTVGIIGRLTPLKGHSYFLKAIFKVTRVIPHLKVWIVGEGKEEYKEELKVLIRRLGLSNIVEFLGRRQDIPQILGQLNLLVLATTTQEAFGRVIIEAQASGVPVVATKVGGVIDIIEDGKDGILVPPKDVQAMAEAIIAVLKDINLASEFTETGRRKVEEKYTLAQMAEKTVEVYQEALKTIRILIIKISALGDVILAIPSVRAVREKYPEAKITCLVGKEASEVLLNCPYIDELIVCDFKDKDKGLSGFLRLVQRLRRSGFDFVIDLQNNRRSHILSFLSFAKNRFGYANGKFSFLLNRKTGLPKVLLEPIEHQFFLLKMLDIDSPSPYLKLWPREEDDRYIEEFLSNQWLGSQKHLVGINLGASRRWQTKVWPLDNFIELSEELAARHIRLIITGSQDDRDRLKGFLELVKIKPIVACGKTTISQLACLIKRCQVFISSDSAPLHIASAMNTPFIALFGPTEPKRHLPPIPSSIANKCTVLKKELSCSPCYKPRCKKVECMYAIKPEEVLEAIEKVLENPDIKNQASK